MKCPSCITKDLVKTQREGFDFDYCTSCNGMWLERGQLDKIISRLNPTEQRHEVKRNENGKITAVQTDHHASPIMENIENSRELYQLSKNKGKHHWIHRLFS